MTRAPDWRDLLQAKLEKIPESSRSTAFRTNPKIDRVLNEAASKRHMSVAAYVRRAAVAFAEHDTGIPWDEIMAGEPGFGIYGERPGRGAIRVDGRGFGKWKIVTLDVHHEDEDD